MRVLPTTYKAVPKRWQPGLYFKWEYGEDSDSYARQTFVDCPYLSGIVIRVPWRHLEPTQGNYTAAPFTDMLQLLADWSAGGSDAIDNRQFYAILQFMVSSWNGAMLNIPLCYVPNTSSWWVVANVEDAVKDQWFAGTGDPGVYGGDVLDFLSPSGTLLSTKCTFQSSAIREAFTRMCRGVAQLLAADANVTRIVGATTAENILQPEQTSGAWWQGKLPGHWGSVANEAAMVALSSALPGDTCTRADQSGRFFMLKSGGVYSVASDWLDAGTSANNTAFDGYRALRTYRNQVQNANQRKTALAYNMGTGAFASALPEVPTVTYNNALVTGGDGRYHDEMSRIWGHGTGAPDLRLGEEPYYSLWRQRQEYMLLAETQSSTWQSPYDGTAQTVSDVLDLASSLGATHLTIEWSPGVAGVTQAEWRANLLAELAARGGPAGFLRTTIPSGYVAA